MKRHIPATMATQHPDNANAPYWSRASASISTQDEIEECYLAFKDLGCQEFMWDWEGKHVNEAVIDRLFSTYTDYFKKYQIGKDWFLDVGVDVGLDRLKRPDPTHPRRWP